MNSEKSKLKTQSEYYGKRQNLETVLGVVKMDNKLNSETLRKIAKIRKEAEKLRDDVKRLHEKIVRIKG